MNTPKIKVYVLESYRQYLGKRLKEIVYLTEEQYNKFLNEYGIKFYDSKTGKWKGREEGV